MFVNIIEAHDGGKLLHLSLVSVMQFSSVMAMRQTKMPNSTLQFIIFK